MPKVERNRFGEKPRIDGKPGHRLITSTTMSFLESDNTDVRMDRVRIYRPDGTLEHTYMRSPMGQRYKDMEEYDDDPKYLEKL